MNYPNDMSSAVYDSPAGQPLPWYEVWRQVLTRPSRDTFRRILADPTAKAQRAFIWVAVIGLISGVLQAIIYQVFGINPMEQFAAAGLPSTAASVTNAICGAIATPILSVIGLAIGAGILRLVASLLGGKGNFGDMAYVAGSISAPMSIISSLLTVITNVATGGMTAVDPTTGMGPGSILTLCLAPIGLAVGVYAIFLQVLGVDTVEKFGTGKAVATVLIPVVLGIILGVCVGLGVAALFFSAFNQ